MTLQFGRIINMPEPLTWDNSGSQNLTITGGFTGASVNAGVAMRNQLLGYPNPDEPIVAVLSTVESSANGFYQVLNVDIPTPPVALISGHFDYRIDLQRVGGYQSAYMESFLNGALMVNSLGITTTAEPFHAFPVASEYNIGVSGYTVENRPVADGSGSIEWVRMNPTGAAPTYKALARWAQLPSGYYQGACQIRNSAPADHVVVGQQDAPPAANGWTLQNGLVSVTVPSFWNVTWADATNTYRSSALMDIKSTDATIASLMPTSGSVKIIRNAPEECILRVPVIGNATSGWPPSQINAYRASPMYLDIAIRRGSRIVRFYLTAATNPNSTTWTWGNRVAVASSAITGGNVWTSNDANSNRVGIFSAMATTNDLVNGRITTTGTTLTAWDFAVAMELGGTGSTNRDTIASQVLQYIGGAGGSQAERMQVVAR
jgi:hypothetical protein